TQKNRTGLGNALADGPICRVANLTARIAAARHLHHQKLNMVLVTRIKGDRHDPLEDTESSPILFRPSVPLCAYVQHVRDHRPPLVVWIVTAHSVAQAMVA